MGGGGAAGAVVVGDALGQQVILLLQVAEERACPGPCVLRADHASESASAAGGWEDWMKKTPH